MLLPAYGWIAEQWIIASQSEVINFGQKITFDIVKPQDVSDWPEALKVKLSGNGSNEEIELSPAKSSATSKLRLSYVGVASKKYVGIVRAELVALSSNRLVMLAPNKNTKSMQVTEVAPSTSSVANTDNPFNNRTAVIIANPGDEPALSAYEPMYFVVGKNSESGIDSRFQSWFFYK